MIIKQSKLKNSFKKYKYDSHRICSPDKTLKKLEKIRKFNITKIERIDKHDIFNIPVFGMFHPPINGRDSKWGKGFTEKQALASGMMEFVERYSASNTENAEIIFGSHNFLDNSISVWDLTPPESIKKRYTKPEVDKKRIK